MWSFRKKYFGQHLLTSVLTKLGWIPEIGQISGQKHEVCKWQGGFLVMRYLTTIFGEETLQSILSTLPNTYGPNVSTYFRIESQKKVKNVIFGYFWYLLTHIEDINIDQRRCLDETRGIKFTSGIRTTAWSDSKHVFPATSRSNNIVIIFLICKEKLILMWFWVKDMI